MLSIVQRLRGCVCGCACVCEHVFVRCFTVQVFSANQLPFAALTRVPNICPRPMDRLRTTPAFVSGIGQPSFYCGQQDVAFEVLSNQQVADYDQDRDYRIDVPPPPPTEPAPTVDFGPPPPPPPLIAKADVEASKIAAEIEQADVPPRPVFKVKVDYGTVPPRPTFGGGVNRSTCADGRRVFNRSTCVSARGAGELAAGPQGRRDGPQGRRPLVDKTYPG